MVYFSISDKDENKSDAMRHFSDSYFPEFFSLLGVTAFPISVKDIGKINTDGNAILFIGAGDHTAVLPQLDSFCRAGGTLIAFGSGGVPELCEMRAVGKIRADMPYTLNGHCVFTEGVAAGMRLPVISDIVHCRPKKDGETPVRISAKSEEYGIPLVFSRMLGKGRTVYFAFSLLQTIWYKTQGKPVLCDTDGDGYMRSGDSIIADPSDPYTIPTVDAYLHEAEDILFESGEAALMHQVPPDDAGDPCDFALYFAGDEDLCGGDEMSDANRELSLRGFPYHVHLQPKDYEGFTVTREWYRALKEEGLELSLHFDFITDKTYGYDFEALRKQTELYRNEFGEKPNVCNTHWFIYNGFGETARAYRRLGLTGTFRQIGFGTDFEDINKMNAFGLAHGTSYPTQSLGDKRYGYKPTGVYDLKIMFYEPRIREKADETRIDEFIRLADEWALTANVFIHPVYLAEDKATVLPAVDRIAAACKEKRVSVPTVTGLVRWWNDRAKSTLIGRGGEYEADFRAPIVIKMPFGAEVTLDGEKADGYEKTIAGKKMTLITVPKGKHTVKIVR